MGVMSERQQKGQRACPICKQVAAAAPDNAAFPFCSSRCRMIDLGNWLDGDYAVPGEPAIDAVDLDAELDEG